MGVNEEKSRQLGMPHGTACNRLRKMVLFHLLAKAEENQCFKCGKLIVSCDELSIEHKKPWLHISSDLFWDMDNIAFSHTGCNRPDRPGGPTLKENLEAPKGKRWCSGCSSYKDFEKFWTGRTRCKHCMNKTKVSYRNRGGAH